MTVWCAGYLTHLDLETGVVEWSLGSRGYLSWSCGRSLLEERDHGLLYRLIGVQDSLLYADKKSFNVESDLIQFQTRNIFSCEVRTWRGTPQPEISTDNAMVELGTRLCSV